MAIDGGRGFAPSPICTIMLRPSTGAATSCLSLSWVIMRLPGRGIALVVSCGHRRGRGFAPSPICTIMLRPSTGAAASHLSPIWAIMKTTRARDRPGSKLWPSTGEELRPVPHLYDNAMAIDGSSCFAPVWTKPPRGRYLWGASFISMESHRLGECYSS